MTPYRIRTLSIGLALWMSVHPGWAARPLVSETADALARSDCELETAIASSRVRGARAEALLDALVACGIGLDTQLSAAYNRSRAAGSTAQVLTLAGKTSLIEAQAGSTGLALAYAASMDQASDLGWHHGGTRVFGVATRALTPQLTAHLNLGWQRNERDRQSSTSWSVGLEGDGAWRWAADVFGDDRTRPWVSAGVIWPLAATVTASLAHAQQFEVPRVRQWTLAFKFDF